MHDTHADHKTDMTLLRPEKVFLRKIAIDFPQRGRLHAGADFDDKARNLCGHLAALGILCCDALKGIHLPPNKRPLKL